MEQKIRCEVTNWDSPNEKKQHCEFYFTQIHNADFVHGLPVVIAVAA